MQHTQRFCTQCGSPLASDARFCGACGHPVRTPEPVMTVTPPATDPVPAAPRSGPPAASPIAAPAGSSEDARAAAPQPASRPPFLRPAASAPVRDVAGASASTGVAPAAHTERIVSTIPGFQRRKGFLGLGMESFTVVLTPSRIVFIYLDNKTMNAFITEARETAKSQGKGWIGQAAAQMGWVNLMVERLQTLGSEAALAQYPGSFFIPNSAISQVRVKQRHNHDYEQPDNEPLQITFDTTTGKQKFTLPTSMGIHERELKQRLQQTLGAIVR